jgi:hypothetical protein
MKSNTNLARISFSFFVLVTPLLLFPHQVLAQNVIWSAIPTSNVTKLLIEDAIRALDTNDVNRALAHLKLIDTDLKAGGNSLPIQTSKLLVEDAIQSLQNGDTTEMNKIYRLGHSDIWACNDCRQKGDIHYMKQHICKGSKHENE